MARAYSVKGCTQRWPVSSITSSTCLGSMPASYSRSTGSRKPRRKVLQQLAEELKAERGRGSRHKVGSSGSNHRKSNRHGGSAGQKELQTEPNVGHLKCHMPVCGNCARRAEVIYFFDFLIYILYIIYELYK